jgi:hypothetical protein
VTETLGPDDLASPKLAHGISYEVSGSGSKFEPNGATLVPTVPEPHSLMLLALGLLICGLTRWPRRRQTI